MRIAHVVRQFYPSFGGLEDFVRNLAREQRQAGAEVAVITLDTNFQSREKLPPRERIDGLDIIRVPYFGSTRYPVAFSAHRHLGGFDVIHIHAIDFFVDYLALLKRLRVLDGKLVVSTHGGIFHTRKLYWLKKLFFRAVTPVSLSGVEAVVASSYADGELFAPIARHVQVIENGVRLQKFGPVSAREPRNDCLFLGRFSDNKNLHTLVRRFARARADTDIMARSPRLYIAGRADTGDVEALRASVRDHGAEHCISVVPDPSDAQLRDIIAGCGVVISASRYEGFGLVVPELMSYGLLPVLSDIPAFAHFVGASRLGALFGDDQLSFNAALGGALQQCSPDTEAMAREFSARYSWETIAQRFEAVYVA